MTVTEFLNNRGFFIFEGNSQQIPEQIQDLINLTQTPNIHVMEIGFNAGHSAEAFLKNNKSLILTSFDIGGRNYVRLAKKYIDIKYPNRHTLILGDSTITVPTYMNENKDKKFDVIFIDGGHTYEVSNADLENCMKLAHKETIVIMDDTIYTSGWEAGHTVGPTRTWVEHVSNNSIIELNRKDYIPARGMSWGKYNL